MSAAYEMGKESMFADAVLPLFDFGVGLSFEENVPGLVGGAKGRLHFLA